MPQTPRIVGLSIYLYRLMLAAYPAAFRQQYGEAMIQLFRDSALESYRQCGLRGLAGMWGRTLADFTISVVREHRETPATADSESILLRDLLWQWGQLGRNALAVSALSLWYTLHLLQVLCQRTLLVGTLLTAIAFGLWGLSFLDPIGSMFNHRGASLRVWNGCVEVFYTYELGEPVSWKQWCNECRLRQEREPDLSTRLIPLPHEFSFLPVCLWSSCLQYDPDILSPKIVRPVKQYRLRFPFAFVPALLSVWTIRILLRRNTNAVAAMQSA